MPSTTGERPRLEHDRDRERPVHPADEARNFDGRGAENSTPPTDPHAGFDSDLNPIDDEFINTHGSER